jgi:hypothetical protein
MMKNLPSRGFALVPTEAAEWCSGAPPAAKMTTNVTGRVLNHLCVGRGDNRGTDGRCDQYAEHGVLQIKMDVTQTP